MCAYISGTQATIHQTDWGVCLRRRVAFGILASIGVIAFTACAPQAAAPPQGSEEIPPPAESAGYCGELADAAILEATRAQWADLAPEDFDAAVAACTDNPDASWADIVLSITQPGPQSLSNLSQVFPVTDKDGYTIDLAVDFDLLSVTADPSSQAPGVTAATRKMTLAMRLVNTTPQRDITFKEVSGIVSPLDYPTFLFSAFFNAGNPVCTLVMQTERSCEWLLGFGRMESGQTISAGLEYPLTVWSGRPNGGEASVLLTGIPEASWAEIEQHLSQPDGYRVTYSGGDGKRFTPLCDTSTMAPVIVQSNGC
jgi:hypothetical protein